MRKIVINKYSLDKKNLSALFTFLFWLVLGFIVLFIGINNTYAATTTTYENIGYLNDVTILYSLSDDPPYPLEIPRGGEYQLYNVERIIVQIDNYTFSGGTTYNLELSLPMATLTNNMYSVIDGNNNNCSIGTTDSSNSSYPNFSFNCSRDTSTLTLNIYNTDGSDILNAGIFRWNYIYLRKQLTTTDTSILENQTSQIIGQNQQIIQGQDEIKDTIKDELNSCRPSKNLFDAYNITFGTPHNSSYIINDSNSITVTNNGGWSRVYATINGLKPNTFYTISANMINNNNIPAGLWINDNNNNLQYNDSRVVVRTTSNGSIDFQFYTNWNSTPNYGQIIYNNIQIEEGSSATTFEKPGEICTNKIDETNDKLNDLNNSLNNSNTTGATNDASNFFSNFTTDTFGLTSIITAPLSLINNITSSSCSTLRLPLPYLENKYLELPCMNTIYSRYFGTFFSLYQTITFGIVSYWVIVRIFNQVKDFKNPEHDEIEVLDL